MSAGQLTPLNINAMGALMSNQGFTINPAAITFMGTSTSVSSYTPGSVVTSTVLSRITECYTLAYQLKEAGSITQTEYNNLISIGSTTIPALANSKPSTYTNTYSGETTKYGFLRLISLQAYNERNAGNGTCSDFVSTFQNAWGFIELHNDTIKSLSLSSTFLDGAFSNLDDLVSGDITGVSKSTLHWGTDLIKTGKSIDLKSIDSFGNPVNLLRTINNNRAASRALNLALLAAGFTSTDISGFDEGATATIEQQKRLYAAFCLIVGSDLDEILVPLNCQTTDLQSLADLLDPKKLFPTSYKTLTYPEYNIVPKSTNSKTYHLIYDNGEVLIKTGFYFGERLMNVLPPQLAFACGAFSNAMMQIKNIQTMNIEKFSQVVTHLEVVSPLNVPTTSVPVNASMSATALTSIANGSDKNGMYSFCDFFGAMTDLHYNWSELENKILALSTPQLTTVYNNIYTVLTSSDYTTLQTEIDNANQELTNIYQTKQSKSDELNTLYNEFGTFLTKEQNARAAAIKDISSSSMDVISFVRSLGQLGLKTESKGPARVLESIADTTNIGGTSIIGSMREARNAEKLGLTGAVQDNGVNDNALVIAPKTGTMSSLNVPIVTGAAVVPGSLAGSPETTLIPPNLSIFNTPSNTTAVLTPEQAIAEVIKCNCDCWDQ